MYGGEKCEYCAKCNTKCAELAWCVQCQQQGLADCSECPFQATPVKGLPDVKDDYAGVNCHNEVFNVNFVYYMDFTSNRVTVLLKIPGGKLQ